MATYSIVSTAIPSNERTATITAIAAGDQVDVKEILGRPARGIIFHTTASTDEITYILNNKMTLRKKRDDASGHIQAWMLQTVEFWDSSKPSFTSTGENIQTVDDLKISSFELVSVTLGTGAVISATVW